MELFSHRAGYKSLRSVLQIESMDDALRNALWSAFSDFVQHTANSWLPQATVILRRLWVEHFKMRSDEIPVWNAPLAFIKKDYFFRCEWYEVYDLFEFARQVCPSNYVAADLEKRVNDALGREMAGYRFVGGRVTPIIDDTQIAAVERAMSNAAVPVRAHLKRAVELLSDRPAPDSRNSIKESVSAVEAACQIVVGSDNATLGQALKRIDPLHPALRKGLEAFYGWTSDAEGIRHAMLDKPTLRTEDAIFMLVICSAFVNYLNAKTT